MNRIQCPHCFTDYKISDEQLRLSQGVVRCGKCMESFDANTAKAAEESAFDPRSAFIEPLSHIEDERKGPSIDDILPDTREVEFKDGSVIKLNKSVVKETPSDDHNNDHALELAAMLKKRKKAQPSQKTQDITNEEPTRPRLNEESVNSIKNSFDPELSVNLDDDDLVFHPSINQELNNDTYSNEPSLSKDSLDEKSSYVMEPSTALQNEFHEHTTEESIQIFSERIEPTIEEPNIQVDAPRLKSRLQRPSNETKETENIEETFSEPKINLPEKTPQIEINVEETLIEQPSETIEPQSSEILEEPKPPIIDNSEDVLIDEVDQLIDDKLVSNAPETEGDDGDLFTKKKKKTAVSRFFTWLIFSPIFLFLIIALSGILIYQLWQKQLISWPDRKEIRALIEPAREPVIDQLEALNINIPSRRNLSALQLLSAKTEAHPARASTILLKVSLINRAKIEQPLPWLELSLKDSDGKVISRRSLSPQDYIHNNRISTEIGARELKKITIELLSFPKNAAGYELKLLNK